jgi:nitroreductase
MLEVIKNRRSIRKYTNQAIPKEKIEEILKAAMTAPSARNTKAWSFVVVQDKELIQKLAKMKAHAAFSFTAQAIIVLCSEDWKYWLQDLSIIIGYIYLEATNQGLGTCMVEAYDSETYDKTDAEEYVKNVLGISSEKRVLGFMPLGFADECREAHSEEEYDDKKIVWI